MRHRSTRNAGFSLLETIVAMAIAALALGILVRTADISLKAARQQRDTAAAVMRARSLLAPFANAAAVSPGIASGQDSNQPGNRTLSWRVQITRLGVAPPYRPLRLSGTTNIPDIALFQVSVTVSWNQGLPPNTITLVDHVLAPVAPAS